MTQLLMSIACSRTQDLNSYSSPDLVQIKNGIFGVTEIRINLEIKLVVIHVIFIKLEVSFWIVEENVESIVSIANLLKTGCSHESTLYTRLFHPVQEKGNSF